MSMDTMATQTPTPGYPVRLDVEYPEKLSRLLIFVKWLLVIPHILIVWALFYAAAAIAVIAFFAVLFTKKYPVGLFDFFVGVQRWTINAYVYGILDMRDEYPPFSWDQGAYPPVRYEVDYPEELRRFSPLYQWILAIPHYFVLFALFVIWAFVWIIAWFAILFTAKYPRGLFDFTEGVFRWTYRVNNYAYFLRNEYPPFTLK
jgi:Domain of unknown function (DUF4389)